MRHVYTNAKAVLILDDWLQQIPSDSPMLEIVARLYQSNWIKRLWTHQEGFLPSALYVQFSDKPVEMETLHNRFTEYQSDLMTVGVYLQFPEATNMRLLSLYTVLKTFMQGVHEVDKKYALYAPLADVMSERKTSRLADETVCLATIIDIDVQPFLDIPDKPDAESARTRMALFLRTIHTFEMRLVFNNYERIEETGYKWAPRSLLNFRIAELYYGHDDRETTFQVVNGKRGLLVQYPGFLVRFANGRPSFGTIQRGCVMKCRPDSPNRAAHDLVSKWLIVELPPNNVRWAESSSQFYAVVLLTIPKEREEPCQAIVGLTTSTPSNDVYTFEHCSIATARVADTAPTWVDTIEASLLEDQTKWLVI